MNLEVFAGFLGRICSRSLVAPGRSLRWTVIVNPSAGGFTIRSRWKKHEEALRLCAEAAEKNPLRPGGASETALKFDRGGLVPTTGPGDALRITEALVDEIRGGLAPKGTGAAPFHLVLTAGGDGTSLEVQTALFHAPVQVLSNLAIVRLPMGTGNDGADAAELDEALELLVKPVRIERARALRLSSSTQGKGPFLAFNILSVGLDAFVTHMTNKMKGKLPGDSYKLWVDIAALLYDRLYHVGPMDVRAFDEKGRELRSFREKLLLLAVGASGHRTYGSRKKILPDDRNVCAVKQMPLLRKVALKGLFTTGEHISKPESLLFNARRVEFSGPYPILAQMDGETVLLEPGDFPGAIELTEPLIPVLKPLTPPL
jgi:diacylglycerol kinase family enzyme